MAGERRWRASRMAGLTEVPVVIKDVSDEQAMEPVSYTHLDVYKRQTVAAAASTG